MNNIVPFNRARPVTDHRRDMLETLMQSMDAHEFFATVDLIIDDWGT